MEQFLYEKQYKFRHKRREPRLLLKGIPRKAEMKDRIKKAGLLCEKCGYQLLIDDYNKIVFCQKCEKKVLPIGA